MITKQYIANNRNKETNTIKMRVATKWNKTSISSLYDAMDDNLDEEIRGVFSINSAQPISYDPETQTMIVELEVDVQDMDFEDEE